MKVLFDLSILGLTAYPQHRGTVGIFRVAEHNARALAVAPDCDPWFCATQNWREARRYFERHLAPEVLPGSRARFARPALPGSGVISVAEDLVIRHGPGRPLRWLQSGRILWLGAKKLLRPMERAATAGLDLYHSPIEALPVWTGRRPGLRRFVTVYDLIPLVRPDLFPAWNQRRLRRLLAGITPRDWVLCISEHTRHDLLAHCPACNPERALVVPLAAESHFYPEPDPAKIAAVRARYGVPEDTPYFLSVSTLEPRKNFEGVIRAYARFVRADPARPSALVLTGGKVRPDTQGIFQTFSAQEEEVRRRIIFTGFVPDADLAALYSGALAFVYLSLYEGFGLPPLEAMQCGAPVIVSDASSLPEVVGDAGVLLAPTDEEAVSVQMRALYDDPACRRALAERGLARAREFGWERFAQGTLAAYRQAMDSPP